jgi:hypothetical protein
MGEAHEPEHLQRKGLDHRVKGSCDIHLEKETRDISCMDQLSGGLNKLEIIMNGLALNECALAVAN